MSKGTPSKFGGKKSHIRCRRCGKHAYNVKEKVCGACGYGKSKKLRSYSWTKSH